MKVVCISDTHMQYPKVPDGDILIHSGDFSFNASLQDTIKFNDWLGTLPHPVKLFVPGNHDRLFDKETELARATLSNATVLIDQSITIDGIKIYGTPWTPTFGKWYFMANETKLAQIYGGIPDSTDVLITHGPPIGILDEVVYFDRDTGVQGIRHCGSTALADRVLAVKPKIHCFGHIHPGYAELDMYGIKFINASLLDDRYVLVNKPIIFEL